MAPALPALALIHPSAWNMNSPKFIYRIVHRSPSQRREDGFQRARRRRRGDYILCMRIIMRGGEYSSSAASYPFAPRASGAGARM
jgi:hypothetical protein